jgi:hypothetical protein
MPEIITIQEAEIRRIMIRDQLCKLFMRPYIENNKSKMNWKCGSRGRVPA